MEVVLEECCGRTGVDTERGEEEGEGEGEEEKAVRGGGDSNGNGYPARGQGIQ